MPTDQPPRGDQEQPPPEKPPVRPRPPEAGSEEPPPQEDAAPDEERRPEPGKRESEWGFLATGAWSPQGDKIVFTHAGNQQGRNAEQIYEMNPDGTGITRTTHTNDNSLIPDWASGVREEADMRRTLGRIRGRGVRRRCSAADSSKGEGG
jgi:hypothetical protein